MGEIHLCGGADAWTWMRMGRDQWVGSGRGKYGGEVLMCIVICMCILVQNELAVHDSRAV